MKKIIISTGSLKPALDKLGNAIHGKNPLPVLNNILCKVSGKQLEMIASNTEVTIHIKAEVEGTEDFEFLLPYDFIKKVVAINKNCPLEIEQAAKLKVKGPTDAYDIKVPEKVEDWPALQQVDTENGVELNSDILFALRTALTTAQPMDGHPKFSHILLELAPGKVTVASSDGKFCVFSKSFEVDHKQKKAELLLSQRMIKVLDAVEAVSVTFTEKVIRFESENLTVYNTRAEDKYVNFRAIFPQDWSPNLTISKSVLMDALIRCSLADDDLHAANINLKKKDSVKFSASDHMVKINVDAAGSYTGSVDTTAINTEKCMKILNQITGDDIELAIHDSKRAIVFTDKGDTGYKGLLMPIAVSNE